VAAYAATDVDRLHVYEKPLRAIARATTIGSGATLDASRGPSSPTPTGPRHQRLRPINLERQANLSAYFTEGTTRTTTLVLPRCMSPPSGAAGVPAPSGRRRLVDLPPRFFVASGLRLGSGGRGFLDAGGFRLVEDGPAQVFENPSARVRS
jgi:hypothetical protein